MKQTRPNNIRPALQQRSQEKRDRLIEVGLTVFSQRGYAQTRMADVAAEAGVSVGVLYQRFQDKRAFFEVIVETLAQRIEQEIDAFFQHADPTWDLTELVSRVVTELVTMIKRDVGFFLALIAVGDEVPNAIERIAAVDQRRAQKVHTFLLETKLVDRSQIDEEKVFFTLATAIRMLLVTATVDREPIRFQDPSIVAKLTVMLSGYLNAAKM